MGSIQEGGVHTQKVSVTLGIIALLMMGAFVCCPFVTDDSAADDETTATINVIADSDFCGVSKTIKYTLTGDNSYYYKADLVNSDDISSGSTSPKASFLTGSAGSYKATITVTAPTTSGDYTFTVKFYESNAENAPVVAEKNVPLKVVDPITLKFTLKNDGDSDVVFEAYFKVNGEKIDASVQSVTVPANGTKDVTYDYYVKDVKDTTYCLSTDSVAIHNNITGLDVEKTFYAHDADYTAITTIVVIVIIILAVVLFFVMRKPVVNRGKPKGRR